jgi:hypothetical protein
MAIHTKGRMNYAFTMVSNMLRDEWAPAVGTDAAWLAYTILSYSGDVERGARLSSRYFRKHLKWTEQRAENAKTALLEQYGQVFTRKEGVKATSTPETWWVDLDLVSEMHETFVLKLRTAKAEKRGPGRPRKPAPESGAGFLQASEKPAPDSRAGFSSLFGKNLLRNPGQPCSGIQGSPAPESGAHKVNKKENAEKKRGGAGSGLTGYGFAQPEHSSSGQADGPNPEGLRNPTPVEARPEPHAEDLPFLEQPAAPVNPAELEAALARLTSPDGAAASASGASPRKLRDETQPLTRQDDQATALEQVPGGGAARPDWLEALAPVTGLLDRPAAEPGSPTYRALKALAGKSLTKYLGEKTRTGQLPRSRWLHLEPGEIDRVRGLAQAEAEVGSENMITLALRGLDRLIGAVKAEAPAESGVPAAAAGQDPQLLPGQRCTVADQVGTLTLGVVLEVNAARYKIRFDDGNGRDVDRTVAAQLRTLKASAAPLPATTPEPEAAAPLVPAGTTWRRIKGKDGQPGEQVTVQAVLGMKRTLSNGAELPVYVITRDFEQVV